MSVGRIPSPMFVDISDFITSGKGAEKDPVVGDIVKASLDISIGAPVGQLAIYDRMRNADQHALTSTVCMQFLHL